MSQKTTRKPGVSEEKEKRQTDSPVKEMKKKMAANAEKEKQAAEKSTDKVEKQAEKHDKPAEKTDKVEKAEKTDKKTDKLEKTDKSDKKTDKVEKVDKTDKKADKVEKKSEPAPQKKEESKDDKAAKSEKPEQRKEKPKLNGTPNVNGTNGDGNGTVSGGDDSDEWTEQDEMFPELAYDSSDAEYEPSDAGSRSLTRRSQEQHETFPVMEDDSSDAEYEIADARSLTRRSQEQEEMFPDLAEDLSNAEYELSDAGERILTRLSQEQDEIFSELEYDSTDAEDEPADDGAFSLTRCSQVKATRTPETPRPASDKQPDKETDDSKILKLKEDTPISTDRKLRSADSPKPQDKKTREKSQEPAKKAQESQEKPQESNDKPQESPKKSQESAKKVSEEKAQESPKKPETETKEKESKDQEEKENGDKVEIDVVIEIEGGDEEPRKTDTNFSKSRVKVSPYRRSMRLADQTTSSVTANYTGNNTTMEMDITESSFASETASLDDSYLSGLRSIRGRRSYKPLQEMTLRHITHTPRPAASEQPNRPTGTVVGRKRKPEPEEDIEVGVDAASLRHKRSRLLERLAGPFRRAPPSPLPPRRAAEIVGINTDLPLTAPVVASDTFDPETLKTAPPSPAEAPPTFPLATDKDSKKCIVM